MAKTKNPTTNNNIYVEVLRQEGKKRLHIRLRDTKVERNIQRTERPVTGEPTGRGKVACVEAERSRQ